VEDRWPDVVLVAPLVGLGSPQNDWVRAAADLGIPTVLPVASWDNLTNKGALKQYPTTIIVWNELQAREAERLHGVPRERLAVCGAHSFDHWFAWSPAETRATFAERVGLPDSGPYLLYVCSSNAVAGDETDFVAEWIARLRSSGAAALADLNVVVRPHPLNASAWDDAALLDERVVVWPRAGEMPTSRERRNDFYDSIYHSSGVVGINTSAFIEASIVGRPAFTVETRRFRATQQGTLHFSHIASGDGSLLVVGRTWEEHFAQIVDSLEHPEAAIERIQAGLRRLVRPAGLDRPAAPLAAAAVERAAGWRRAPVVVGAS
jgi:hypothetical protein